MAASTINPRSLSSLRIQARPTESDPPDTAASTRLPRGSWMRCRKVSVTICRMGTFRSGGGAGIQTPDTADMSRMLKPTELHRRNLSILQQGGRQQGQHHLVMARERIA